MKLELLCRSAEIAYPEETANIEIAGVAMDSREAVPGGLFICVRGLHSDGHDYISNAVARGTLCVLCEGKYTPYRENGVWYLYSEDTRRAAAYLYDAWYGFPTRQMRFIGVTGTNGKTSVTQMLATLLEAGMHRCGVIGTVGCRSRDRVLSAHGKDPLANMTTPDPPELYRILAEMADDGVEFVLMEVSSHALALGKVSPIRFELAVFTNLTPEHLDFHKTMDAYAAAKASLFSSCRTALINLDSEYAARMPASCNGRVITCSVQSAADYCAQDYEDLGTAGVRYRLASRAARMRIFCPIPGRFTVINSMQAAVAALELGVPLRTVKDALASLGGVKGRMERVKLGPGADFSVIIDYAHTPDALEKLLETVRAMTEGRGRVVLVFGCGGDRDIGKRAVMGGIAARLADRIVVTSDNSRSEKPSAIIENILQGIPSSCDYSVIPDREEAIKAVVCQALPHDIIVLAGKGHEEYEITRNGRRVFCEREIVARAYRARVEQEKNTRTETEL